MVKVNDNIICKKYYSDTRATFIKGGCYKVRNIFTSWCVVIENNDGIPVSFFFNDDGDVAGVPIFENYFYSENEIRKMKLSKIKNEWKFTT